MKNKKTTDWKEKVEQAVAAQGLAFLPSYAMQTVYRQIYDASQTNSSVLVLGETGVGKDQIASIIHSLSKDGKPFEAANCAGWSTSDPAWSRGELFGQTDLIDRRTWKERWQDGLFHKANNGLAFLDEIGELPPQVQAMLLRMLETGEIMPLNGFPPDMPDCERELRSKVNVRVIVGTNRDVTDPSVIRQDLYYRLSAFVITVPPLRERPKDIKRLAEVIAYKWFLNPDHEQKVSALINASKETHQKALEAVDKEDARNALKKASKFPQSGQLFFAGWDHPSSETSVRYLLESAPWIGNVRDLKHTLERALSSAENLPLRADNFPTLKAEQCYEAGNQALRRNQLDVAAEHYATAAKQAEKAGGDLQQILVDASKAWADANIRLAEVRLPTLAHVPSTWKDVADVWKAYNDALEALEQIPSHLRRDDALRLQAEVFIKCAELYRRYPRLVLHAHTPESGKNGGKNGSAPTDRPVEDYSHAIDAYTHVLERKETPNRSGRRVRKLTPDAKAEYYCLRGKAYLRRGAARRFPRFLPGPLKKPKEEPIQDFCKTACEQLRGPVENTRRVSGSGTSDFVTIPGLPTQFPYSPDIRTWAVNTMIDQILTASASLWPHIPPDEKLDRGVIIHQDLLFSMSVVRYAIKFARTGQQYELCDLLDRLSAQLDSVANWNKHLRRPDDEKKSDDDGDDNKHAYGLTVPDEAAGLADIADALDDFDEGLRLDSENADGHFHKGVALLASSHLGVAKSRLAAIRCFKKTLNLDSGYGEADEEFWGTLALAALAQHVLTLDGDWESLLGGRVTGRSPEPGSESVFLSFVRFGAVSKRKADGYNWLAGFNVDALAAHQTLQLYIDIFTVALVVMEPEEIWKTLTDTYNEQPLSSRKAEFMNVAKDFRHRVFYAPSVEPMLLRQPRHNRLKRRYCFLWEEPEPVTSMGVQDFIQHGGLRLADE